MVRRRIVFLALAALGCGHKALPWSVAAADRATVRHLAQGEVIGGLGRYDSHAWLGLPYAAPPVGELRWRAPKPAPAWTGLKEALTFAPPCPQYATPIGGVSGRQGQIVGTEDCLYLNVWAPRFAPDAVPKGSDRLPVMLWIHGGGNSIGSSSSYEGGRLATDQGVIVVSLQYRLGALGWLSHRGLRAGLTDAAERSGNFGTLDQVAALRWVHENIGAFGGDPDRVTVFGESAGGTDTFAMLVSPLARGLFSRAIVESGNLSSTTPEYAEHFVDDPVPGGKNSSNEVLAQILIREGRAKDRAEAKAKVAALSDAEAGAVLRRQSVADLMAAYDVDKRLAMLQMPFLFQDGAALPATSWLEAFARPDGWNKMPVILGTNRDEMKLFLFLDPRLIPKRLGFIPRFRDENRYLGLAEWTSRFWKARGADLPAEAMVKSGATDIYEYRFDWHDEPTIFGADLSKMIGAGHGLEIPFVFGHFDLGRIAERLFPNDRRPSAEALSAAMRGYWGHFARDGKPDNGGHVDAPKWTAWTAAPGAPRLLDLDIASAGGLRMNADPPETRESILSGVAQDSRLPDAVDKCRTYYLLNTPAHAADRSDYPPAGTKGCEAYPLEKFPWVD